MSPRRLGIAALIVGAIALAAWIAYRIGFWAGAI